MAKREQFTLTLVQCQRLTETCLTARAAFPKKWGEKAIPDDEQVVAKEDIGALLMAIRAYSPWLQGIGDDFRPVFGDKADWYPADKDGKKLEVADYGDGRIVNWKWLDGTKKYVLRLDRNAVSGVVWCCILRLHTHATIVTSTIDAVDIWWAIAEVVGKATAVRKYIGLAAAKRTEWEDDPELPQND